MQSNLITVKYVVNLYTQTSFIHAAMFLYLIHGVTGYCNLLTYVLAVGLKVFIDVFLTTPRCLRTTSNTSNTSNTVRCAVPPCMNLVQVAEQIKCQETSHDLKSSCREQVQENQESVQDTLEQESHVYVDHNNDEDHSLN